MTAPPMAFWSVSSGQRLQPPGCERCDGRIRKASTSDMPSTAITTIGTWPRICPNVPVSSSSGAKAAMVVSTPMNTGEKTPRTPAIEASGPTCSPASRSVMMFSPTTTASSTTIPMTMINANSDTMLMFTPRYGSSRKAPMNEIGTPIATQNASRRSSISTRNRNTSANPRVPLRSSRLRRPARISVWSAQTARSTPAAGSSVATRCFTASAISMASSASDFRTRTKMLSRPSYWLMRSTSANPSRMTATSPRRRMLPSGAARSTMSSNSSPVSRLALVRSRRSPAPVRISPDDRLSEDTRTAAATWLIDRSWRRRASSRTSMAIS